MLRKSIANMNISRLAAALTVAVAAALAVTPAYAHAFGERYNLPLPLNYFVIGGAATVALSFVVIGLFVQGRSGSFNYPRYNLLNAPVLGAVLRSRSLLGIVRALLVAIFALVVATALFGTNRPLNNLSPVMVWIIWWVGMGYLSALAGHFWMLVNPWKITYEWAERLLGGSTRGGEAAMFRYPDKWDVWPALALFLAFAWIENVYVGAVEPFKLGILVLLYSLITWAGMVAFGKQTWLRHGEAFSVLFGFFARFSPTEVRITDPRLCRECDYECDDGGCVDCYRCFERARPEQRELNLRPYAAGLAHSGRVTTATAIFVIVVLATVTFDGLQETQAWFNLHSSLVTVFGGGTIGIVDTLGLLLLPAIFLGVYLLVTYGIRALSGEEASVPEVAKAFVFSLVPIALAYHLAHFISFLLIQGQLIIPLSSDPFGFGWDLLGTADYRINTGVIGARSVWFLSLIAIVLGHIISVYIAHVIALRRVGDHRVAVRGQYPMLVLMVFYTATSLWIIAQPIVEG